MLNNKHNCLAGSLAKIGCKKINTLNYMDKLDRSHCVIFIVPAFNAAKTIHRTIRSILRQHGVSVYVIVVDHGSVDETSEKVIKDFGSDHRVFIIRLKRSKEELASASRPLNVGFLHGLDLTPTLGRQTWFARLDADDFLATDFIVHSMLSEGEEAQFITGFLIFYSLEEGKSVLYGPRVEHRTREKLLYGGAYALAHHATLISAELLREVLKKNGFFYWEKISYGEDLDFTMQLLYLVDNDELRFVEQPVLFKFCGDDTITSSTSARKIWKDHRLLFRKHQDLPWFMLLRLAFDLVLRKGGKPFRMLRLMLGFPAMAVGSEKQVDHAATLNRLVELDARSTK